MEFCQSRKVGTLKFHSAKFVQILLVKRIISLSEILRYVVSLTVQSLDISLIPLQDYPLITQDWAIARIVQLLGKVTRDIACLCL